MEKVAFKEIPIFDNSISKVKSIISQTRTNVENIVETIQKAMQQGEEISPECVHIFEEILNLSTSRNNIVFEIANSAQEQAKGVERNKLCHV